MIIWWDTIYMRVSKELDGGWVFMKCNPERSVHIYRESLCLNKGFDDWGF